jgi:hypothetical protein
MSETLHCHCGREAGDGGAYAVYPGPDGPVAVHDSCRGWPGSGRAYGPGLPPEGVPVAGTAKPPATEQDMIPGRNHPGAL